MDLPGIFGTLAPFLDDYGYAAVGLILLLDNVGIPLPGEAVLVTGAIFAGAAQLNLATLAAVAFIAAVLGGNSSYALGRYGGRPLVERLGRRFGVTPERLDRVEGFFGRHGTKVVVVGRFLPLVRQTYGIAAGTSCMPWRKFLVANTVGAALWTAVWTTVGYRAGGNIEQVEAYLTAGAPYVGGFVLLVVVALVLRAQVRRRRLAGVREMAS